MVPRTAHSEELRALLEQADDETLDEILESVGSLEELVEAVRLVKRTAPMGDMPSSPHVAPSHRRRAFGSEE
ncbi:MAG TPA: hypothetical protein VL326_25850 [Kofleriaceae bacterium]|jgi:hypothetical protein|nr:hypothetical protein [Kofleriaceae bacterium]